MRDQAIGFWYGDLAGLPRLASARLIGEYPIARVEFEDPELPVRVALTAFTPFVPLDADASGIPATVLRYPVTNPGDVPVSVTIAGSLSHVGGDAKNHHNVFTTGSPPPLDRHRPGATMGTSADSTSRWTSTPAIASTAR